MFSYGRGTPVSVGCDGFRHKIAPIRILRMTLEMLSFFLAPKDAFSTQICFKMVMMDRAGQFFLVFGTPSSNESCV